MKKEKLRFYMVNNIFKFIGDSMILMFKLEVGFVAHVILLCLVCIVYEYIINFINKRGW